MRIEVLGTGCPKCETLVKNVTEAARQLDLQPEIIKVTDIAEIARRGVLMPPALCIDGEVKLVGKLATVEELKGLLES